MELEGVIKLIDRTQSFGDKGFQKRDLVLTTEEKYPQDVLIQFAQDKCEVLDKYKVGEKVKIGINIGGRAWTKDGVTKYFNTIKGWRIESSEKQEVEAVTSSQFAPDRDEDLPF